jgi:hypothetical protein
LGIKDFKRIFGGEFCIPVLLTLGGSVTINPILIIIVVSAQ